MIINLFVILILYAIVFLLAEYLYKKSVSPEITRKIAHIGGGLVSVLLPVLLNFWLVIFVGIFFLSILLISQKKNLLNSIHKIKNKNMGAVLFPVGLLITFILFAPHRAFIFQGAVLVLALADGLGGLLGQIFGRRKYNFTGEKTWEGSLIFLLMTYLVLFGLFYLVGASISIWLIVWILVGSLLITIIEGLLGRGWDNLAVPVVCGAVIYFLLQIL